MKQRFLQLPLRDQLALMILGAALLLYLALMVLVLPLERARDRLQATNDATAQVLHRVDRMAATLQAQRDTAQRPASTRNLSTVLNGSAEALGLRISRLQPNSRGGVQLRLESAAFDALLRWLHGLEEQGLLLEEVSISQVGTAGMVSASLRVSGGP